MGYTKKYARLPFPSGFFDISEMLSDRVIDSSHAAAIKI